MKKGYRKFFDSIFILSIKRGLMLAIPFLILGSFALLLSSFPLDAYQSFLTSFHHGALLTVFNSLYEITLNSLALILIITIALSYGQLHALDDVFFYPVVAMVSYLAFCGGMEYANEIFHPEWVFTAMCITMLSCWLFHKGMHCGRRFEKLHTAGADYTFNKAIQGIFPIAAIALFFAVIGAVLRAQFGEVNITNFGAYLFMGSLVFWNTWYQYAADGRKAVSGARYSDQSAAGTGGTASNGNIHKDFSGYVCLYGRLRCCIMSDYGDAFKSEKE